VFTAAEALGLVMAVLDGHHDAGDAVDPVGAALGKLMRALPASVAAQAEAVRRATAPAPDRAAARPDPETAAALVEASSQQRQVRLDYRSEAGSEWVVAVDPWAVVVRHGRWYLLCRNHEADALRAYRIDRVRGVEVLDETFTPSSDLDPVAMLERHLAAGWEYDVELVIDAPRSAVAPCLPPVLGVLEALDSGTTRLVGTTSNPVWYAEQLAVMPASYRIVKGPELQAAAAEIGQRLLAAAGTLVPRELSGPVCSSGVPDVAGSRRSSTRRSRSAPG
jgi:predicted DNA-binding transcriptional regulator YafY